MNSSTWQEQQYLDLLTLLLDKGQWVQGRNARVASLFGHQMRFDLSQSFPLLTTKKVHWKSIVVELLWFLQGNTNLAYLHEHGVTIWDEWGDENGDLGPIYGKQWRDFAGVDQINRLLEGLHKEPYSRRHLVSAWNPSELDKMSLPPCHVMFQCYVSHDKRLSLQLYQRSADVFLGLPFNIASYALLTCLLARALGYQPGELIWTGGDVHLYENHHDQARLQLQRKPFSLPKLKFFTHNHDLFAYQLGDFAIEDYQHHPTIKAEVSK